MVIYKTTNLLNGKFYVGQDSKNNLNYLGSGLLLQRAITKYGRENFKKEILETCNSKEELNDKEIYWIEKLNAIKEGYNIATGGEGGDTYSNNPNIKNIKNKFIGDKNPMYGRSVYDIWLEKYGKDEADKRLKKSSDKFKISTNCKAWNSNKKNVYSKETLKKMSDCKKGEKNPMYGIKLNKETRNKISVANKGKKRSEEVKEKMRESSKKTNRNGENNPSYKHINLIQLKELIKSHSITQCCKILNVSRPLIKNRIELIKKKGV